MLARASAAQMYAYSASASRSMSKKSKQPVRAPPDVPYILEFLFERARGGEGTRSARARRVSGGAGKLEIWQGGVRRADPPAGRECSDALLPIAKYGPEMDRGAHLWNPRAANAFTTPM